MTLGLTTKKNEALSICYDIRVKWDAFPPEPAEPPEEDDNEISIKITSISASIASSYNSSISLLENELEDINANINIGYMLGSYQILNQTNLNDAILDKWLLIGHIGNGDIYDDLITILTNIYALESELQVETDLGGAITEVGNTVSLVLNILNTITNLNSLFTTSTKALGEIGILMGIPNIVFNAMYDNNSIIAEINSNIANSMTSLYNAKALGETPKEIFDEAKANINTSLGLDTSLTSYKNTLSNLLTNF